MAQKKAAKKCKASGDKVYIVERGRGGRYVSKAYAKKRWRTKE